MAENYRETCFEFIEGDSRATYCTGSRRRITKLRRQAQQYPELVEIIAENEDGSVLAHVPVSWFKDPAPKRNVSESQRLALSERAKSVGLGKKTNKGDNET